jgi:hypothetical protein
MSHVVYTPGFADNLLGTLWDSTIMWAHSPNKSYLSVPMSVSVFPCPCLCLCVSMYLYLPILETLTHTYPIIQSVCDIGGCLSLSAVFEIHLPFHKVRKVSCLGRWV